MKVGQFVKKMKLIYNKLINYIEENDNDEILFQEVSNIFDEQKIRDDAQSLKSFFTMIVKIGNYHQHNPNFFTKIYKILELFKNDIMKSFTNITIFNIFKSNKIIFLFLLEQGIMTLDETIISTITNTEYKAFYYDQYFDPEITNFKLNKDVEKKEDFVLKRQEGENDNYICKLIREDNIDEFIVYMNQYNIPFDSNIKNSIFETNLFLLKKKYNTH